MNVIARLERCYLIFNKEFPTPQAGDDQPQSHPAGRRLRGGLASNFWRRALTFSARPPMTRPICCYCVPGSRARTQTPSSLLPPALHSSSGGRLSASVCLGSWARHTRTRRPLFSHPASSLPLEADRVLLCARQLGPPARAELPAKLQDQLVVPRPLSEVLSLVVEITADDRRGLVRVPVARTVLAVGRC